MKIAVCVKRVPDMDVRFRIGADEASVGGRGRGRRRHISGRRCGCTRPAARVVRALHVVVLGARVFHDFRRAVLRPVVDDEPFNGIHAGQLMLAWRGIARCRACR